MKAVLFDLDGVLIDSYRVWYAVINGFARDHGYPAISDDLMKQGWGQGVDADAEMFFPGTDIADLNAYYFEHFLDHLDGLKIDDGASALFQSLRAIGCKTAIVTNTPHELTVRLLSRVPLLPDEVIGTSQSLRAKPEPDMLLRACELLGVSSQEAFMIGDSVFDRDASAAAGTTFLSYRWDGGRRVNELSEVVEVVGRKRVLGS